MQAFIEAINYHLPSSVLTNEAINEAYPDWSVNKIEAKTGIVERPIAAVGECASDLAAAAASDLFSSGACRPTDVDYVLLCTQSPDYFLPTTACLLQDRLGLRQEVGALDFNLGCSGFVYGLSLAKGLVETGQARRVLLLTAETYSKFIHPEDRSARTIFSDAAAATLIGCAGKHGAAVGPFVFGTDGGGARNLIVETGGLRRKETDTQAQTLSPRPDYLYMNGAEIFTFSLRAVPSAVHQLLDRAGKALDDIDLFVFHQANAYMLEHLRSKMRIPASKFVVCLRTCGNSVSSTIPIALKHAEREGRLKSGHLVLLVGFGVGYSWGATLVRWA